MCLFICFCVCCLHKCIYLYIYIYISIHTKIGCNSKYDSPKIITNHKATIIQQATVFIKKNRRTNAEETKNIYAMHEAKG